MSVDQFFIYDFIISQRKNEFTVFFFFGCCFIPGMVYEKYSIMFVTSQCAKSLIINLNFLFYFFKTEFCDSNRVFLNLYCKSLYLPFCAIFARFALVSSPQYGSERSIEHNNGSLAVTMDKYWFYVKRWPRPILPAPSSLTNKLTKYFFIQISQLDQHTSFDVVHPFRVLVNWHRSGIIWLSITK